MPEHGDTTRDIIAALSAKHYVSKVLDDDLSEKIFLGYLDDLDPSRSYFLKSDVCRFEPLRFEFDDALHRGDMTPAYDIFNAYHSRVIARFEYVIAYLGGGIDNLDFTKDETLLLDRSEQPWAKTQAELDDLWRKRIKNAVLDLRLTDKTPEKIQELLLKRYKNRLIRTRQTNSEDVYQLFMNAFTANYDPHTQYLSPRTLENFNIDMRLSLEGVGAVLRREDEYTRVVSLVPAGPADKSKQLFPDDRILAVGQGSVGEMIDVVGWRLDEVVQLIRGKKNTLVRLDVVRDGGKDSDAKVISITRNTVKLEEQSAKSDTIEIDLHGVKQRIGVIDIPTFYVDFSAQKLGRKNYKSTTTDVSRLVSELKQTSIDGLIIDLRNNGGGALQEARTLTGLFIDRGPTVQVRHKHNRIEQLADYNSSTAYDGPVVVLVNRLSASASEIFTGAMQDYQRALIIGSRTFGKGTVQTLLPLNHGQLKMTLAKYYRISGESTQHQGVVPDIMFPNEFDPQSIGEGALEAPLPWDKIPSAYYVARGSVLPVLDQLRSRHTTRTAQDPEFQYLEDAAAYRQARREIEVITLNEQKHRKERDAADAFWLALENTKRKAQGLDAVDSLAALHEDITLAGNTPVPSNPSATSVASDTVNADKKTQAALGDDAITGITTMTTASGNASDTPAHDIESAADKTQKNKPDPYLIEAGNILLDWVSLNKQTAKEYAAEGDF